MSVAQERDLLDYCTSAAREAKAAAAELAQVSGGQKNAWLRKSAARLRERTEAILDANKVDLEAAPGFGLTDAAIDRLTLNPKRIHEIAVGLEEVAALPDPVGEVIESSVRPNGLQILKTRVPLGVVFFIYESRPNVTADAAAYHNPQRSVRSRTVSNADKNPKGFPVVRLRRGVAKCYRPRGYGSRRD